MSYDTRQGRPHQTSHLFAGHALTCNCPECSEHLRLQEQRITRDAPTGSLPSSAVSLQELVDNARVTLPPRYEIGEDWNDD
jgi:hypothetical protein